MKKLVLLDGMAITYRAYYALNGAPRTNSKGMNTGAVLGFTMTLYDLVKKLRPTHMAVAFDLQKPTFRHELYKEYKANRDAMPEAIQWGLPYIKQIIAAFNIPSSPAKVMRPTMSLAPPPIGPTSRASTRS